MILKTLKSISLHHKIFNHFKMTTIISIIIFILGTAIGSFLSVVVYRVKKKEKGIFLSRSICPSCKKKIKWQHLVPVFSWLYLRGKCTYCNRKISFHYFMLELITGTIFLLAFLKWNFLHVVPLNTNPEIVSYMIDWEIFKNLIFYLIEFTFLILIFFYDFLYKEIPDRFSIPPIVIALAGGYILGNLAFSSLIIGGFAIFIFFLLQFVLSKGAWIGGGDLRMGALMGFLLGWQQGLIALAIAYVLGGFFSLILLAKGKLERKSQIAFGPFLSAATILVAFLGEKILDFYLINLVA